MNARSCRSKSQWSQRSLKYKCPLFARKFRNTTARAVHDALIECEVRHGGEALRFSGSRGTNIWSLSRVISLP